MFIIVIYSLSGDTSSLDDAFLLTASGSCYKIANYHTKKQEWIRSC